jgi:hypothetical protein
VIMQDPYDRDDYEDRSSLYEYDPFAEPDEPSPEDAFDLYEALDFEELSGEVHEALAYEQIEPGITPTPKLLADHYPGGFPIARPDRLHLLLPWVLHPGNMELVEASLAAAAKATMAALRAIPSEDLSRLSPRKRDWVRAKVIEAEVAVRTHQLWLDAKYACAVCCSRPIPKGLSCEALGVVAKYNRPMRWFVDARGALFASPEFQCWVKVRNALAKRKPATRAQGRRYDASDVAKAARAARKKPSTPESRAAEARRKRDARAATARQRAQVAAILAAVGEDQPTATDDASSVSGTRAHAVGACG